MRGYCNLQWQTKREHLACFEDRGLDVAFCFELVMEFVFSIKTLIYMYNLSMTQGSSHSRRMLRQATRPAGAAD